MLGQPSIPFIRKHRWRLDELPRDLTGEGIEGLPPSRVVCACGWKGPARQSRTVANGDGFDHVQSEWNHRHD